MFVKRYFHTVADVVFESNDYGCAYALLTKIYSAGLTPELQIYERDFPSVTLCNCVKHILDEIEGKEAIGPYLKEFHKQLEPMPGYKNTLPELLDDKIYECHTTSNGQRCTVMTLALAIGVTSRIITEKQKLAFNNFFLADKEHYSQFPAILLKLTPEDERYLLHEPEEMIALHDQCLAMAIMESVELSMSRLEPAAKRKFLGDTAELFMGDKSYLYRMVSGLLVHRFDLMEREIKAEQAANDAAASPPIPSADEGTTKGATADQLALLFYYLFRELHIDFTNSDKTAWARLIHFISGHSIENLRKYLNIDFDKKSVQKDLGIVQGALQELFPAVAQRIENDKKG